MRTQKDIIECLFLSIMATIIMVSLVIFSSSKTFAAEPNLAIEVNKETHTLTLYRPNSDLPWDRTIIGQYDIIIGKPGTQTPSFETAFNIITVNPTWNPAPKSQAHLRKHPELRSHYGIKVASNGSYYAPPSEKNPMGKARLELQYKEPIRIHGTSEPELFQTDRRNYSSGCIRVLEIQRLAEDIVGEPIDWNKTHIIKLPYTINVTVH